MGGCGVQGRINVSRPNSDISYTDYFSSCMYVVFFLNLVNPRRRVSQDSSSLTLSVGAETQRYV